MPLLYLGSGFFHGQQALPSGAEGVAAALQGAGEAVGVLRGALQRAKIHHALIEGRCLSGRKQALGQGREFLLGGGGAHGRFHSKMAGKDPVHIAIYYGGRQSKANGANGRGGVVSYTLEGRNAFQSGRKCAQSDDLLRGGVQVPGTGIIAQTLPEAHHLVFGCGGQVLNRWETFEETFPVIHALYNPGLLEDNFTEPDGVRVLRAAPGKVPAVARVPVQYGLGKRMHQRKLCSFS